MVLRSSPAVSAFLPVAAALLSSCGTRAEGLPISLNDPLGLIDDSEEIRLYLMPAETHVCMSGGVVVPEVENAPVGETDGAVVDLRLTSAGGAIMQEVSIPPGSYVALVRGRGTDPTSMVRDAVIATGCADVLDLAANESRGIAITLQPVTSDGVCSDAILSPDEQCTTPGVGDCSASCQTTAFQVNSTAVGAQEQPRVAGRGTNRILTTFISERVALLARVLGPDGQFLTSPTLLTADRDVNEALVDTGFSRLSGSIVNVHPAVAATGRMAMSAVIVPSAGQFNVRVGFFDTSLGPEGDFVAITDDAGREDGVVGAFAADGAYLAAFVEDSSGVAVRTFAPGARMPTGSASTSIAPGATAPAVAGLATGFAVAYEMAGRVMVQRVDGSGAPMGAAIAAFDESGEQSQPAIAPLASGGFVVACRDGSVDGNGTGIRARVFDAGGTGLASFQANSSAAGDQALPAVAAHEDRIAIAFETGGAIHARFFTATGGEALNREPTPSFDEFEVAPAGTEPGVAAVGSGSTALWFFTFRSLADGLGDVFGRRIPR